MRIELTTFPHQALRRGAIGRDSREFRPDPSVRVDTSQALLATVRATPKEPAQPDAGSASHPPPTLAAWRVEIANATLRSTGRRSRGDERRWLADSLSDTERDAYDPGHRYVTANPATKPEREARLADQLADFNATATDA